MTDPFQTALLSRFGEEGVRSASVGGVLEAFELITVDEEGWPHVAWLSPGEVMPLPDAGLALALWPDSSTTSNIQRTGRALAELVDSGILFKARLRAEMTGSLTVGEHLLTGVVCSIEDVSSDVVNYAVVESGPRYILNDSATVTARWDEQLNELTALVKRGRSGDGQGAGS